MLAHAGRDSEKLRSRQAGRQTEMWGSSRVWGGGCVTCMGGCSWDHSVYRWLLMGLKCVGVIVNGIGGC